MAGRSRVLGVSRVKRVLRMLPDQIASDLRGSVKEAADLVHDDALPNIPEPGSHPYATGQLKRSFRVRISRNGLKATIGPGKDAPHANIVEHGAAPHQIPMPDGRVIDHPGAPAQPFLWPAFERNRRAAYTLMKRAVLRALQRAARMHTGDTA